MPKASIVQCSSPFDCPLVYHQCIIIIFVGNCVKCSKRKVHQQKDTINTAHSEVDILVRCTLHFLNRAVAHWLHLQGWQVLHRSCWPRLRHRNLDRRRSCCRLLVRGLWPPIQQLSNQPRIQDLRAREKDWPSVRYRSLGVGVRRTVILSQYLYIIMTLRSIHKVKKNNPSI